MSDNTGAPGQHPLVSAVLDLPLEFCYTFYQLQKFCMDRYEAVLHAIRQ
jgi:hypothetical protein